MWNRRDHISSQHLEITYAFKRSKFHSCLEIWMMSIYYWCLSLQLVSKVTVEQFLCSWEIVNQLFERNQRVFFSGELRSSVRISHGNENFGFRCWATPIITIITLIPKSWIGILEEKNFFVGASSEGLTVVLGSQVWEHFFVHYSNKCLRLASENFALAM